MELRIVEVKSHKIAEIESEQIVIHNTQDALDIMGNSSYQGASSLIIREVHLTPEFFDLKSGVAGDILLKFSNYRIQLAIIGKFTKYESKSLNALISESNRGNQIFFVPDRAAAIAKIVG